MRQKITLKQLYEHKQSRSIVYAKQVKNQTEAIKESVK